MPAPAGIKSICGRLPEDRWLIISAAILNVILGSQEALQGCLCGTQDVDLCKVALSEVKVCRDIIIMQ